jgi:hypothetical protein
MGGKMKGGEGKEREDMGGEGNNHGRGKLRHDSWGMNAPAYVYGCHHRCPTALVTVIQFKPDS